MENEQYHTKSKEARKREVETELKDYQENEVPGPDEVKQARGKMTIFSRAVR